MDFSAGYIAAVPENTPKLASGQFKAALLSEFKSLGINRAAHASYAFETVGSSEGGVLLVDDEHWTQVQRSVPSLIPRVILVGTAEHAASALDAMDFGAKGVFLDDVRSQDIAEILQTGAVLREAGFSSMPSVADLTTQMKALASQIESLVSRTSGSNTLRHIERVDFSSEKLSAAQVRAHIRNRRARESYFPNSLFADPAWDILLDLMAARLEGRRVSVSSLCIASAVPPTTALRWIKTLTDEKFLARSADPADGRRIFVHLTDRAVAAMEAYLQRTAMLAGSGAALNAA